MKAAVVVRAASLADVAELVRLTEDTVVTPGRVKAAGGRGGRYTDLLAARTVRCWWPSTTEAIRSSVWS